MAKTKARAKTTIRLVGHRIDERAPSDLYEVGHEVVFRRGNEKNASSLELYVGWVSVGGLANQVASDGEGSRYIVWRASPEGKDAQARGVWLNGGEPTSGEVESFVKGIVQHIAAEHPGDV